MEDDQDIDDVWELDERSKRLRLTTSPSRVAFQSGIFRDSIIARAFLRVSQASSGLLRSASDYARVVSVSVLHVVHSTLLSVASIHVPAKVQLRPSTGLHQPLP